MGEGGSSVALSTHAPLLIVLVLEIRALFGALLSEAVLGIIRAFLGSTMVKAGFSLVYIL